MAEENKLQKGSLGLWYVVFFVVAAASPLTGVVGALPVAFMAGNGAGVAGTFIVAGALLLIFSFGLVAMSRYVVNAGAFYSYIVQGLGVTCGLAGFNVALLAYAAMQLSCSAMFGFFTEQFVTRHLGISLPWWGYAALMQLLVIALGIAKVEIGGKVLGILMLLEIAIVLLMDLVFMTRPVSWEFSSFQPSTVLNGNFGIAMVFAICSFIGFEATAIYAEECREPKKIVAKATFTAVILITVFYALTAWVFVQYTGANNIVAEAAKDPGVYVYNVAEQLLGGWSVDLISVLLITSLFAATQAFHNSLSRYLFTISRDGLLWSKLAKTHATYKTPYIASIAQGIFMIAAQVVFGLLQLDPMINIFAWASVLGSMAILVLQIGVSFAVIKYFQQHKDLPVSIWSRLIAPIISALGMLLMLYVVIGNLEMLSGSSSPVVLFLPWLLLACMLIGMITARVLKHINPQKYANVTDIVTHS
ncbi:APC family permease [Acinetobacter sp. VNH17]|uniref:APC family permease n=1 Tax=Acinetobacter thutiue TaxID=2998078 RepID=A0ABT7WMX9_9GAMM|nr:APC family permease [Acinetobacter thutiue]MCY6411928.1 APC family permease [Acinetobacter thutiue]MDN0014032.1 APC family permease [Acinetobacter thutiue]